MEGAVEKAKGVLEGRPGKKVRVISTVGEGVVREVVNGRNVRSYVDGY